MKVSVIITAYNLDQFIRDAIDSVLAQTRKPDEIVIVDDCSNDNTASIILSYGDRVSYFKMPQNSGGLSATFHGVKQASGDILCFLDGDDLWMPEKIESILPLFEQYPSMAIVSHDYVRVNADLKPMAYIDDTQENILRILHQFRTTEEQSEAFKDSILGKKGYWGGSAYSLRRSYINVEAFDRWLKSFELIRKTYLDLVLPTFMIVSDPAIMVGYIHKKLFKYRIHVNNTSGNKLPSIAAAKRALGFGHSTTIATYGMLSEHRDFEIYRKRQSLNILEYEYLIDIYDSHKIAALKKFSFLSRNFWTSKQIIKELQRLIISLVFGPKFFLYLKNRFT